MATTTSNDPVSGTLAWHGFLHDGWARAVAPKCWHETGAAVLTHEADEDDDLPAGEVVQDMRQTLQTEIERLGGAAALDGDPAELEAVRQMMSAFVDQARALDEDDGELDGHRLRAQGERRLGVCWRGGEVMYTGDREQALNVACGWE